MLCKKRRSLNVEKCDWINGKKRGEKCLQKLSNLSPLKANKTNKKTFN